MEAVLKAKLLIWGQAMSSESYFDPPSSLEIQRDEPTSWLECAAANVRTVYANLPYDQMHAPIVGPSNPYTKNGLAAGLRNHRAGHVEVLLKAWTSLAFWYQMLINFAWMHHRRKCIPLVSHASLHIRLKCCKKVAFKVCPQTNIR